MNIKHLSTPLSVIQVAVFDPTWLTIKPLFLAQTPEECSIVLPTAAVPNETLAREDGWQALMIVGVLDFSLVGILADLSGLLAAHQISIFAVSTYNTDYLLIKEQQIHHAKEILAAHGYTLVTESKS
ncbi:ACT domain-containing protein [Enterococcus sp.]|uniref:ACT domain-containing protein n=1 Tax=Enterococcus sp. TaxID=35783 RepID=UPI0028A88A9D|nr:ACT domain-containing protein [Enterococcus sp.]